MSEAATAEDGADGTAWSEFCARIAAVGNRLLDDDFPAAPQDRAEGYRHLANQVACWLTYSVGYSDAAQPAFFRSSDPTYQWGGPNADQVARRAVLTGEGEYRISGSMGSCEQFVLQIKRGGTQSGGADVGVEVSASSLGLGPGDEFEIHLGGTQKPGHWFALEPDTTFVHVRDYYFDWQPAEPATFVIERLDTQGLPLPAITPGRLSTMLQEAAREIEHSLQFWNRYQTRLRATAVLNTFSPPAGVARGVQDVLYSHAFISLTGDDAVLLEIEPAQGQLWDVQLYNRSWYEALDFRNRVSSLNHRQTTPDPDGRVRIVITNSDPGWPYWLDTEGRAEVLATIRWWHPPQVPVVTSEVLPRTGLLHRLPPGRPSLTADERRSQIRGRAAHAAWRYRS